jgi:hypothetical protein
MINSILLNISDFKVMLCLLKNKMERGIIIPIRNLTNSGEKSVYGFQEAANALSTTQGFSVQNCGEDYRLKSGFFELKTFFPE